MQTESKNVQKACSGLVGHDKHENKTKSTGNRNKNGSKKLDCLPQCGDIMGFSATHIVIINST
jgi:hypothetical protein